MARAFILHAITLALLIIVCVWIQPSTRIITRSQARPVIALESGSGLRLLVLVIASKHAIYGMNWAVWSLSMQQHPRVDVYFMVSDPDLESPMTVDEDTHVITVKLVEEHIPGLLSKTVKSLQFFLNNHSRRYTHVLRTNLSSMWHWERLLAFIASLSYADDFAAGNMNYHEKAYVPYFLSGSGILMTRGVVELVSRHAQELRYDLIDDVALGIFLHQHNVTRVPMPRCDFTLNTLPQPLDSNNTCFHYRVKNDAREFYDWYILPRLFFELYYPPSRFVSD